MYIAIVAKNHVVHIHRNNKCSILSPSQMATAQSQMKCLKKAEG